MQEGCTTTPQYPPQPCCLLYLFSIFFTPLFSPPTKWSHSRRRQQIHQHYLNGGTSSYSITWLTVEGGADESRPTGMQRWGRGGIPARPLSQS